MTWIIRVEHIDEKTGECISSRADIEDESVKNSNLDALDLAFQKITDELNAQLKENK